MSDGNAFHQRNPNSNDRDHLVEQSSNEVYECNTIQCKCFHMTEKTLNCFTKIYVESCHLIGHGSPFRHVPHPICPSLAAAGGAEKRLRDRSRTLVFHQHSQATRVELVLAGELCTAGKRYKYGFFSIDVTNLEEVGSWPPGPESKLSQIWHGVASPWHGCRSGTC